MVSAAATVEVVVELAVDEAVAVEDLVTVEDAAAVAVEVEVLPGVEVRPEEVAEVLVAPAVEREFFLHVKKMTF